MRPDKVNNSQEDLFKNILSNQLNPKHELLLSSIIPWEQLEQEFADLFAENSALGRAAKPVRLIVGLLLQHMHNLSDADAEVVRSWVENFYWQYFCGYDFIEWSLPINPSSLTRVNA